MELKNRKTNPNERAKEKYPTSDNIHCIDHELKKQKKHDKNKPERKKYENKKEKSKTQLSF